MLDPVSSSLQGQWLGHYEAKADEETSRGTITLDLDGGASSYAGTCTILEDSPPTGVGAVYSVEISRNGAQVSGAGQLIFLADAKVNQLFPLPSGESVVEDRQFGRVLQLNGGADVSEDGSSLRIVATWESDLPSTGISQVFRFDQELPSEIESMEVDWETFKREVGAKNSRLVAFRGQPSQKRLRTAFHRAGRAHMLRFASEDISELRSAVSGVLSYLFAPDNSEHFAALMALAQHHGYPTPLLDWTLSPYVAAYFAVNTVVNPEKKLKPRIYELDREVLLKHQRNALSISSPLLTVTGLTPIPLHNPRIVPQQSLVTFSNIEDIERFLLNIEQRSGEKVIRAYDLVDDYAKVLSELRLMGIHAGSMYPGLDGACQSLAEKNFLRPPEAVEESDVERSPLA